MRLLLDTHVLLWSGDRPERLPSDLVDLIADPQSDIVFSAVSIWEIAIRYARGRPDFRTDPALVLRRFREEAYRELVITSEHTLRVATLPPVHSDPFDRLLIAQALVEGLTLVTADALLASCPAMTRII